MLGAKRRPENGNFLTIITHHGSVIVSYGQQIMRELLFIFSNQGEIIRRAVLYVVGVLLAGWVIAQGAVMTVAEIRDHMSRQELPQQNAGTVRTYTITRSVLDGPTSTGSITNMKVGTPAQGLK